MVCLTSVACMSRTSTMEVSTKGTLDAVTVSARLLFTSSTTLCSMGAALNIHNSALALKICCALVCTWAIAVVAAAPIM